MKAILEFDLPEETDLYQYAINGSRYLYVLQELDNELRSLIKYENKEVISIEKVRDLIRTLLDERGVKLDG